jgi:hypothetical protein
MVLSRQPSIKGHKLTQPFSISYTQSCTARVLPCGCLDNNPIGCVEPCSISGPRPMTAGLFVLGA